MIDDDELVMDLDHESKEEYSKKDGDKTKTKRKDVHVKTRYGTTLVKKDSDCDKCGSVADGVVIVGDGDSFGGSMSWYKPVCDDCLEVVRLKNHLDDDGFKWEEFEEEVEE